MHRRVVSLPRVAAIVAMAVTAALAPATGAAAAGPVRFTYSVQTRGVVFADVHEFAAIVQHTLTDPRGWSLGGNVQFTRVESGGDFRVVLASPAAVASASGVCSASYSCRVGDDVLINDARWRLGSPPYVGSLEDYRTYLVSHEVGHWLGFGHAGCPVPGAPAPIMVQQSKGLGGCTATAWPSAAELTQLSDRLGVSGAPFGSLDLVAMAGRSVHIAGWAIDPDTADPIDVHVYVDGHGVGTRADRSRVDVGAAFPGVGDRHGFDLRLEIGAGIHQICVYAIDVEGAANTTLGCRTIFYISPFGALDVVQDVNGAMRVAGWAIDPDTTGPIEVHVYAGGQLITGLRAGSPRPDVGAAHPGYGDAHGFDLVVPLPPSSSGDVCAFGIETGLGANMLLGCLSLIPSTVVHG